MTTTRSFASSPKPRRGKEGKEAGSPSWYHGAMLDADRHALSASVYHSAIVIKEKELQNLTSYLTNIGTQSALLFGFSVAFISEVPDATPVWLLFFYYSIATVCLGANMYALTMATLCTVLAPTLALNGPRGSMHTAVKGMYEERTMIWNAFTIGAMAFSIDMLIFIWIILSQNGDSGDLAVAAFCTVVFIAFAVICVNGSKRIIGRFTDDNSPAAGGGSGGVSATGSGAGQMKAEEFLKAQNAAQMLDNAPSKRGEGTGVGGIGGEGSMLEDMKRQIATNSNKAKRPTSKI